MDHQEQQFNQTMKLLQENTTRFTYIVSSVLQMMGVTFKQQRNNVMFPEIIIHLMTQAFPNARDTRTSNMLNGMDKKGM